MLLTKAMICERLGGCTWRTAQSRLKQLGLEPRKLGRECYLVEEELERAISGTPKETEEPNWDALRRIAQYTRNKGKSV